MWGASDVGGVGGGGGGGRGISIKFRDESIWHSASPAPFCLAVAGVRAGMSGVRVHVCCVDNEAGADWAGARGRHSVGQGCPQIFDIL